MKHITLLLFSALIILSAYTFRSNVQWKIQEGSEIAFTSKNPKGIFKKFDGEIIFDENNLSSSMFLIRVHAESINTGNGMKNKHAKSENWFDVENHPYIHFASSSISKTDDGYEVLGTLTIKDESKQLSFPFTFEDNTFKASFEFDRSAYSFGATKGPQTKAATILQVDINVPVSKL